MNNQVETICQLAKEIGSLNYQRSYKKLEQIGIYPGQQILIELIHKNQGISQSQLAKLSIRTPATITTMLSHMEKNGYISKKVDEKDKRATRLFLTTKGERILKQIKTQKKEEMRIILKDITDEELTTIHNVLQKIKNNLEGKQ